MWLLLLPLAVLVSVQGAQYGDYGAVKMPAYGDYDVPREAASDDYRRPAAASLDYKHEEENIGITDRQKPLRKQSKRLRDEEYSDDGRSHDGERKLRSGDDKAREIRARAAHKRREDGEDEFSIEKYIQGINENNLDADGAPASRRTTDRIIRRKPRDRDNADMGPSAPAFKEPGEFEEDAPLSPVGRAPHPPKEDQFMQDFREDTRSGEQMDELGGRHPPGPGMAMLPVEKRVRGNPGDMEPMGPRRRPYSQEAEGPGPPRLRPAQRARLDPGAPEYDTEYYDLKRMRSMRRRPEPELRSEASEEVGPNLAPGVPFAELENLDAGGRRLFQPSRGRPAAKPPRRPPPRRPFSTTTRRPTTRWTKITTRSSTTPSTTTTTTTTLSTTLSTAAKDATSELPTLTPTRHGKDATSKELSLAEKSRLSIMKKASRKERVGGPTTTKPPVLLQVTKAMPTVVMVASSTPGDPWMRAREVGGDTPETLARVRQLMRAKLVANAKDIRDLTEDWDQEVCDYVDVKLLENAAPPARAVPFASLLVMVALSKYL